MIAARGLDGAFERLGAGIGEEHLVGEGRGDQPLGEPALAGNLVEVGDVPELAGLLGQRRDEMRVAVAERVDGDAAGEIEIALAVVGDQPAALAPLEGQGRPRKGLVKRRTAHYMRLRNRQSGHRRQGGLLARGAAKNQKAAQAAADRNHIVVFGHEVNENVAQRSAASAFPALVHELHSGKLGKTEKTDSCCISDSCHRVSR